MAIDFLSSTTMKAMPEVASTRNVKRSADYAQSTIGSSESAARKYSADEVAITNEGKLLADATEQAKLCDGIDYEKVAALQKQIEDGTFEIDYMKTAKNFLAFETGISF